MTRLLMACLVAFSSALGQGQTAAENPLQGDLGVHDPVMIRAGGTYFIFATGQGIAVKTSADRITWRNAGRALTSMPAWHARTVPGNTGDLWAPDISFRDGKYWLYYSVSTFGSRISAIGLATSAELKASGTVWQDQGLVVASDESKNYNAIDPNVILDDQGRPWLAFGSFWSGIQLIRLDPMTGKPDSGATLVGLAQHSGGIEAPFLVRRGAYFYQFVSWDRCCNGASSTYSIRAGRSGTLTGPYVDSKGMRMLSGGGDLIDAGDSRWKGPGHNALFAEGDTLFLVNHAYDAQRNGASILWIRPLYWTPQGWPTLDPKQGSVTTGLSSRPNHKRLEEKMRLQAVGLGRTPPSRLKGWQATGRRGLRENTATPFSCGQ